MQFTDRHQAGRMLAKRLLHLKDRHPIILALPRGGVPVGYEVAHELEAPLSILLVRKIGAAGQPELAIGAVAEGDPPEVFVEPRRVAQEAMDTLYFETAKTREMQEIKRRRELYFADDKGVDVRDRTGIIVDDGVATGATMLAAIRATRRRQPAHLVVAVPVASADAVAWLRAEADEVVCLSMPVNFMAVGQFYIQFPQLDDEEVIRLLKEAKNFGGASSTGRRGGDTPTQRG